MEIESSAASRSRQIYLVSKTVSFLCWKREAKSQSKKAMEGRRSSGIGWGAWNVPGPFLLEHYKFIKLSHIIYFRIWRRFRLFFLRLPKAEWWDCRGRLCISQQIKHILKWPCTHPEKRRKSFSASQKNHLHHLRFCLHPERESLDLRSSNT